MGNLIRRYHKALRDTVFWRALKHKPPPAIGCELSNTAEARPYSLLNFFIGGKTIARLGTIVRTWHSVFTAGSCIARSFITDSDAGSISTPELIENLLVHALVSRQISHRAQSVTQKTLPVPAKCESVGQMLLA